MSEENTISTRKRKKLTEEELYRKEKLDVIAQILELYFNTTREERHNPFWYGETFDNLYDKDYLELRLILKVYQHTRKHGSKEM